MKRDIYNPGDYVSRIRARSRETRYEAVWRWCKAMAGVVLAMAIFGLIAAYMIANARVADAAVSAAPVCQMNTNTTGFCYE